MKEFDKVIGYEPIVSQLTQVIDMMQNKEAYKKLKARSIWERAETERDKYGT